MELILYSVTSLMIDAYSEYEKNYRMLIKMMKNNTSQESKDEFVTLTLAKNKIIKLEKENDTLKANLNEAINRIKHLENELKKE